MLKNYENNGAEEIGLVTPTPGMLCVFQADLYAGAIFIEQALQWDIYWAMMLLLAIAAIFTITGDFFILDVGGLVQV